MAPPYLATGDEEALFRAAHARELPVLVKSPTGCGKTRLVESMAAELGRTLITVACHEDLTGADRHRPGVARADRAVRLGRLSTDQATREACATGGPLTWHCRLLPRWAPRCCRRTPTPGRSSPSPAAAPDWAGRW
ncbi:AAA family ATPase, partial [Mycobacterium sp.]|uniref:AAA family ATPase n=1 Tax=Mycobacterium sp. TaxID=1785 RepID=UPI003C75D8DC